MSEIKPDKEDVISAISSKVLSITNSISSYEKNGLSPVKMNSDFFISLEQLEKLINNVSTFSMANTDEITLICGKQYISLKYAFQMLIYNGMQQEYLKLYEMVTGNELLDITKMIEELRTHINNYMIAIWS